MNPFVATGVTLLPMTAQRRGSAVDPRTQHAALLKFAVQSDKLGYWDKRSAFEELGNRKASEIGIDWIRDPGTYVYTPLPAARNAYRSVRAHFAPQLEGPEPSSLQEDLFRLGAGSRAACLYWGERGFAGELRGAFSMSEPGCGSDPSRVQTTAVPDESTNEWVPNGEKIFVTTGCRAEGVVV